MASLQDVVRRIAKRALPRSAVEAYRRWSYDQPRHNVVIILQAGENPAWWLRSTPSTYRVMRLQDSEEETGFGAASSRVTLFGAEEHQKQLAKHALISSGLEAVFVGRVDRAPRPFRARTEPMVHPVAAAVSLPFLDQLGGSTADDSPATLLGRTRATGVEYGVVPVSADSDASYGVSTRPTDVLILAAVPMFDAGGGSRSAQLALELLRRGLRVDYVSVFPSYETTDFGLRFVHAGLAEYRLDEYMGFDRDVATAGGWVLVEAPTKEALEVAGELGRQGWSTCYDIIDRWSDPSLGGDWYEREVEDQLIESAEVIVVSAADLAHRPRRMGRKSVLIPNGVDPEVFGSQVGPLPDDLPQGSSIIGYHGSLYGDWLDWDALSDVAGRYPDSIVVVIGDERSGHPPMAGNVRFLGMKPQHVLADYVSRFDVGILPFEVSQTTHAVSPLKVFEYLASGVPVAAPPLRSLEGLDGVYTAESLVGAVEEAFSAPRPDRVRAVEEHGWPARVDLLLESWGLDPGKRLSEPARREVRPVVRYGRSERLIG